MRGLSRHATIIGLQSVMADLLVRESILRFLHNHLRRSYCCQAPPVVANGNPKHTLTPRSPSNLPIILIVSAYSIGYLTWMFRRIVPTPTAVALLATLCLTSACGQFRMPTLTSASSPQPTIPASVTLIFDESVRKATLEHTTCADTVWTGKLGDAIIRSFKDTGQARFAQVTIGEEAGRAVSTSAAQTPSFTASITLARKSFKPRTRTGSDDQYISQLDIQLGTVLKDANGKSLAEPPLLFSEQVKVYTPQFGGSGQCATGSLDEIMNTAAEYLAGQLTSYVAELTAKAQGKTPGGPQLAGGAVPLAGTSTLTVRSTLLDENNNLLLEQGEKVGIRIDVTNNGVTPSGPATVALSGTPALIDAFVGALASPVQIASLQAGETTSAMLWGRLPATLNETRGELTVTVTPSGTTGSTPAAQTLVATMAARGGAAPSTISPAVRSSPNTSGGGQDPDRYAVIVGLSLYRSPWPGWREGLTLDTKKTVSLFADGLNVPVGHTLLLQDELAAQEDIEEALASWLPKQVTKNSIVFFYFSGQALADARTGEVFLIPYDSTPTSSRTRLISLRFLQSRLQRLGAKVTLALIDSPLSQGAGSKDPKTKLAAPNWLGDLSGSSDPKAGTLVQVARLTDASGSQQDLLQGLTGPADLDRDGVVTVGEWLRSLRGSAVTAPTLPPNLAVQSIPLTHTNHK